MEKEEKYPLEQIVAIKKRRLEEAEKVLAEKKALLEKELAKLKTLKEQRDEVKQHKEAKLQQLREKLDAGTTTDKIQQMKHYFKLVEEKLKQEELKVKEQEKQVDIAEKQVEAARQDLFKKQKDIEKLKIHHKEWSAELQDWIEQRDSVETDEMGNAMHSMKKRTYKKNTHG